MPALTRSQCNTKEVKQSQKSRRTKASNPKPIESVTPVRRKAKSNVTTSPSERSQKCYNQTELSKAALSTKLMQVALKSFQTGFSETAMVPREQMKEIGEFITE